jgi:2-methylcitrate dehydratase PrpD
VHRGGRGDARRFAIASEGELLRVDWLYQHGLLQDLAAQAAELSDPVEVRNTIYKENGYCFHTQKAIDAFGNAGCKFDNAGDVPLNAAERHNVSAIKKVEAKKGC